MNGKQFFSVIILLLIGVGLFDASFPIVGCEGKSRIYSLNDEKNNSETKKSAALFDNFIYRGEDDFYNENPLPGPESFYNPILPGWYSDPSICTNGEDYFLVTSTFTYFPGVPIFHSKDLVNWKQIGHVLDRPSQLVNMQGQHVSGGIFAPDIKYNPYNKTYYMITTNVGAGNFFVKAQNPFGKWSDPILLPEVQGIDPSFFFDEDGKAYIVNNDAPEGKPEYDGHRVIKIQEFDVKTDKTIGPRIILVNKGSRPEDKPIWIEGPHMYKINGKYFLMAAEGGTGNWHSEVIFRGDAPMGKFIPWENNPILTQRHLDPARSNPITCAGHADLIRAKEGDWWAVFLACRPIDNLFENLGRETFMMPVKWSKDGFPYMTQGKDAVPMILKREGVKRGENVTFGNFEKRDDFDKPTLGPEWMTLRGPATDLYSLTNKPGYLALLCADIDATEKKTPAFICRRMQHHKFECTTRLLFNPSNEKEAAGILLFKDESHQYFLSVSESKGLLHIILEKVSKTGKETLAENKVTNLNKAINLKVVSLGTYYNFYFGIDKDKWQLLCQNVPAQYLSTANCGGFTGTTIGMYATTNK
jgi:alpha-N-arabinofuranosidase